MSLMLTVVSSIRTIFVSLKSHHFSSGLHNNNKYIFFQFTILHWLFVYYSAITRYFGAY